MVVEVKDKPNFDVEVELDDLKKEMEMVLKIVVVVQEE
jgi:hypothetical protein